MARAAVRATASGNSLSPRDVAVLDERAALAQPRGAFVTLRKAGRLRGCIGYVEGIEPLWRAVLDNACSAASRDPRFPPVTAGELDAIEIEISALTPLADISGPSEVRIGTDGLIVSEGGRRGLLLPQVAVEHRMEPERFLDETCRKAGLPADAWRSGARIQRFQAEVFSESEIGD